MPSRRHCRQTGPMYRAKSLLLTLSFRCGLQPGWPSSRLYGPDISGPSYTRRFFGGRQPLCGIGVTSLIARTSIPAVDSARTADSRPDPGPLTRTSTVRSPLSVALLAAVRAACWAANGVPLRDPRNPSEPALDQAMVLPSWSLMVTMVLLKVAWTCTTPTWTTRFSFFLKLFFLPVFAGAFAILCLRRCLLLVGHRSAARTLARAGVGMGALAPHRQAAAVPQSAVRAHLDVPLDVHRDLLAEIAFHGAFVFQDLADAVDFVLAQVADFLIEIDTGPVKERAGAGTADAVNVREPDLGPLRRRQVYTGNTCHSLSLPLSLFMFRVDTDDPHHAFA